MRHFRERTLSLSDGRVLSYAEHGPMDGIPLLFCHGFPGSRLNGMGFSQAAWDLGVRLMVVDRPGIGGSSPPPGAYSLLDWATDMDAFCTALDIERGYFIGVSGGGPYALACAWKMPRRVIRVGIVCGLGPTHLAGNLRGMNLFARSMIQLTAASPVWSARMLRLLGGPVKHFRQQSVRLVRHFMPEKDRATLGRRQIRHILGDYTREALAQGTAALANDLNNYSHDWGFALEEIPVPVVLWQGDRDNIVPPVMAQYLATWLPKGKLHILPGEGHYAAIFNHGEAMLTELVDEKD